MPVFIHTSVGEFPCSRDRASCPNKDFIVTSPPEYAQGRYFVADSSVCSGNNKVRKVRNSSTHACQGTTMQPNVAPPVQANVQRPQSKLLRVQLAPPAPSTTPCRWHWWARYVFLYYYCYYHFSLSFLYSVVLSSKFLDSILDSAMVLLAQ
ncbi:hypothetical protein F5Y08DRAFT_265152 [Xylaria arbuscula]|nr:hypothetical protein F5Y08DRAFT_265152 [Xylaria arbuscula]